MHYTAHWESTLHLTHALARSPHLHRNAARSMKGPCACACTHARTHKANYLLVVWTVAFGSTLISSCQEVAISQMTEPGISASTFRNKPMRLVCEASGAKVVVEGVDKGATSERLNTNVSSSTITCCKHTCRTSFCSICLGCFWRLLKCIYKSN